MVARFLVGGEEDDFDASPKVSFFGPFAEFGLTMRTGATPEGNEGGLRESHEGVVGSFKFRNCESGRWDDAGDGSGWWRNLFRWSEDDVRAFLSWGGLG